jgi:hypothetical protein
MHLSIILGILIMGSSTALIIRYISSLKEEAGKPGNSWWSILLGELIAGGAAFYFFLFLIGFLLVIKPFKI